MPAKNTSFYDAFDDDIDDSFETAPDPVAVEALPVEAVRGQRSRSRRGGPRTALPLIPVIGICAGVALAYVAQTAHVTKASYQATSLAAENVQLQQQERKLLDEIDRLSSSARVDAAAQRLGMRPPGKWTFVATAAAPVTIPPAPQTVAAHDPADPVQRLVAALSGTFGTGEAEAAGR